MNADNRFGQGAFSDDIRAIAPLVVEYFNWLNGHGGRDPEQLLAEGLTPAQKELLRERIDDVNFVYMITAPIREANEEAELRALAASPKDVSYLN